MKRPYLVSGTNRFSNALPPIQRNVKEGPGRVVCVRERRIGPEIRRTGESRSGGENKLGNGNGASDGNGKGNGIAWSQCVEGRWTET
jgi:hypothetical protein